MTKELGKVFHLDETYIHDYLDLKHYDFYRLWVSHSLVRFFC
jgi:hypothetical protein